MANARADLDGVALDLHPPAAPVAELAAGHVRVEPLAVQLEAGGQALDDRHEPGPVRLARGGEAEVTHGGRGYSVVTPSVDAAGATRA